MRWRQSNLSKRRMPWLVLTIFLTGCSHHVGNEYFCPPTVAYDQTGAARPDVYAVDRSCYKSMTQKMKACYTEAR